MLPCRRVTCPAGQRECSGQSQERYAYFSHTWSSYDGYIGDALSSSLRHLREWSETAANRRSSLAFAKMPQLAYRAVCDARRQNVCTRLHPYTM